MKKVLWVIFASILIFSVPRSCPAKIQSDILPERVELAALEFVLSAENLALYKEMSDIEKAEWAHRFWQAMDPTPTTLVNEYYEEFRSRVAYAYRNFHSVQPPYHIDDRGRYYIKYGPPDDRVESVGVGKAYRNNVTWVYYAYNLFIDFVETTGFGYREVNDLSEAISGAPQNEKVRIASALYLERAELSERYLRFRQVRDHLEYFSEIQEFTHEKQLAAQKAPPVVYTFEHHVDPLTVRLASSVFRGDSSRSRVELYFAIPLSEITFQPGANDLLTSSLLAHFFVYDQGFMQIEKSSEHHPLYARPGDNLTARSYINQHISELEPGRYFLTLQFENPESKRMAIFKSALNVRAFPEDELAVSDIQLAYQVTENEQGQFVKPNGLQVVPYVSSVVFQNRPIMIYYEIYNLSLDSEGKTRFQLSYDLIHISDEGGFVKDLAAHITNFLRRTPSQEVIGSSFESSGLRKFDQIYSRLDLAKARPGRKRLVVLVKDLQTGKSATSSIEFLLK